MTAEEAKRNQDRIVEHFNLGYWYGINCEMCCGVYPKLITGIHPNDLCRYECEVCGKTTKSYLMPWEAEAAWNERRFITGPARLF